MGSPICEVKDGVGAYSATTSGVNVTPGATITIHLVSSADVDTWGIECLTTDDLSVAATVNASLVINSTAKTATFTAPVAGRAYRFRSRVGNPVLGYDRNGTLQSSFAATFCVYTLIDTKRVHALDETVEGGTFGYGTDLNAVIRSGSGGAVPTGTGWRKIVANIEQAIAEPVDLADATEVTGSVSISSQVSGLAAGVSGFLTVPTSANLLAAVTNETGTGALVFGTSPTFTTSIAVGTAVPIAGTIRLEGGATLWYDVGGTARKGLEFTAAAEVIVGGFGTSECNGIYLRVNNGTVRSQIAGVNQFIVSTTSIANSVPTIGDSAPYGVHGGVTHSFASDANYTVTSAQYALDDIEFTTGSLTAPRTVTFPHPASKALGYRKTVFNDSVYALTISTGTGSTDVLLPGMRRSYWFDSGGVRLDETNANAVATTDVTPVYRTLATLGVGEVRQIDVVAKVAASDASTRQVFKLSGLYYGAAGPTATIDGALSTTATGTGSALVTMEVTGAIVRLKITGIATAVTTTYDVAIT